MRPMTSAVVFSGNSASMYILRMFVEYIWLYRRGKGGECLTSLGIFQKFLLEGGSDVEAAGMRTKERNLVFFFF